MIPRSQQGGTAIFARVLTWGWTLIVLIPLVYLVSISLSASSARDQFVLWIFPKNPTLANYPAAFELLASLDQPLPRVFGNSLLVTITAVAMATLLATLAAYAIVFFRFPGRKLLFTLLCVGLVVPTSVMIIPEFLAVKSLGLRGTPALIAAYTAFGISLPTLLLASFFAAIPKSVLEAARLDGASAWRVLWSIVVPLSRPVLATVSLLLFITFWSEFPLASTLASDASQSTIPVALSRMSSRQGLPYPIVASVMVLASIPLLAIMAVGQRQLVTGLVQGAERG